MQIAVRENHWKAYKATGIFDPYIILTQYVPSVLNID